MEPMGRAYSCGGAEQLRGTFRLPDRHRHSRQSDARRGDPICILQIVENRQTGFEQALSFREVPLGRDMMCSPSAT